MTNPKVDAFIENAVSWKAELEALRRLLLNTELTEDFKWRGPCYTVDGKAVVMLGNFKNYCALGFFKGALLADPYHLLVAPGENSQSMRMVHFTNLNEIGSRSAALKEYLLEAIRNEKAGLRVHFKQPDEQNIPEEFQERLNQDEALKKAFYALTPGRQRAYLLFFSGAKTSKTRRTRVDASIPRILDGLGLHD